MSDSQPQNQVDQTPQNESQNPQLSLQEWCDDIADTIKEFPLGLQGDVDDLIELQDDISQVISDMKSLLTTVKKMVKDAKKQSKPSKA